MDEIDYNKIDKRCIPMVKFFNKMGLKTRWSCHGHRYGGLRKQKFEIIFDECVSDLDILAFLERFNVRFQNHTPFVGTFKKWVRNCDGKFVFQWMYSVDYSCARWNCRYADDDLLTMKDICER